MSFSASPTSENNKVERLLAALEGVVSARVVADSNGRLVEIHILASHEMHPKQIVRNVESALSAGFGMLVDRRVISVAQLRPDATELPTGPLDDDDDAAGQPKRLVLVGFDTTCTAPLDASCAVTLLCDAHTVVGSGNGANTPQGRAEAAARAVFDALAICETDLRLGFESAALIEVNNRSYVLVAAHTVAGRRTQLLTGVAPVGRSPEEAAILASLQATNRSASRAA